MCVRVCVCVCVCVCGCLSVWLSVCLSVMVGDGCKRGDQSSKREQGCSDSLCTNKRTTPHPKAEKKGMLLTAREELKDCREAAMESRVSAALSFINVSNSCAFSSRNALVAKQQASKTKEMSVHISRNLPPPPLSLSLDLGLSARTR